MLLNALVFSVSVLVIRLLSPAVPLAVIMAFAVGGQMLFLGVRNQRGLRPGRGASRRLHLLRAALLLLSMFAGFYSVAELPLAISTSVSFSKAMFVTLFAALLLAERVDAWRWLAVGIGFAGVLLLSAPDGAAVITPGGLVAGVISAAAAALAAILTRHLAQSESVSTLLLYQTMMGLVLLVPAAIWVWQPLGPGTLLLLALVAGLSVIGNFSLIAALRAAEASVLAPVDFARAVFAGALGYLVLSEVPGPLALLGMAVIVLGTVMSLRAPADERR